jgi:hypothetical protein
MKHKWRMQCNIQIKIWDVMAWAENFLRIASTGGNRIVGARSGKFGIKLDHNHKSTYVKASNDLWASMTGDFLTCWATVNVLRYTLHIGVCSLIYDRWIKNIVKRIGKKMSWWHGDREWIALYKFGTKQRWNSKILEQIKHQGTSLRFI